MSTSMSVLVGAVVLLLVIGVPVVLLILGLMFFKPKKKVGPKLAHEQERDEIMANVSDAFIAKWAEKRTADLAAQFKKIMGE